MRQVSLLLLLVLLPVFSAIGMRGDLPSESWTLGRLGWLLIISLLLLGLIHTLSPRLNWARTKQVPLLVLAMLVASSTALAMLVSWANLPATEWLLVLIPATVGLVMLVLWLLVTAFGNRDFSNFFIIGFFVISIPLDWAVWHVLVQQGAYG